MEEIKTLQNVVSAGQPVPFVLRFLEKIEIPGKSSPNGVTYVGATPTPKGDTYDYDQD